MRRGPAFALRTLFFAYYFFRVLLSNALLLDYASRLVSPSPSIALDCMALVKQGPQRSGASSTAISLTPASTRSWARDFRSSV